MRRRRRKPLRQTDPCDPEYVALFVLIYGTVAVLLILAALDVIP